MNLENKKKIGGSKETMKMKIIKAMTRMKMNRKASYKKTKILSETLY
jgi:hypothetical protein